MKVHGKSIQLKSEIPLTKMLTEDNNKYWKKPIPIVRIRDHFPQQYIQICVLMVKISEAILQKEKTSDSRTSVSNEH